MKTKFLILGTLFVNAVMFAEKDSETIPELVRLEFADLFPARLLPQNGLKMDLFMQQNMLKILKTLRFF